ncbi:uncharacterized protein Aud_003648 [Aspergillus udagawae]|uniref:Zn(2)-C6 fungal-type domain-containing protein n=1 Tax=Aspergillus udagawae TaxID=91492 RepID=A0A8E0QLW0_9EURO|nr:uncharacterized protein Aud_003648 [Aspergillus udagawae]GIC87264.1 hypothetical protein Aud_003648 [Aspergillus udagawae]
MRCVRRYYEAKPYCERCREGGFHCEGYVCHVEFIDATTRLNQGQSAKRDRSLVQPVPRAEAARDSGDSIYNNPQWDEQHICVSHLVNRLFTWHTDDASPYSASWITVLLHPRDPTGLSTTSLRALATTYFGKVHTHPDLVRKGAGLYPQALQSLRVQLECPCRVLESDLLVAVICLATLESVCACSILRLAPALLGAHADCPHRHQSGVGAALLPTLRSCIAIGYIVERRRCFLEGSAWKSIPWAGRIGSKTPIDYLHDVFSDIPGLLENLDRVTAWSPNIPGRDEFLGQVRQNALSILEILYSWRCKWQEDNPDTAFFIPSSNSGSDGLPPSPFKTVIWFTDPYRANELIVYDSVLLIVLKAAEGLGLNLGEPHSSMTNPSDLLPPIQSNRNEVAIEVCRMVNYHLHCLQRSSGAFMLLFPLNVAYRNLEPESDEARWMEKIMAVTADIHGFEIGRRENMLQARNVST